MPWLQLKIQTDKPNVDAISDWLTEHEALSVTWEDNADQPLFEPPPGETPLWSETLITGLFDMNTDIDSVMDQLHKQQPDQFTACRSELLEDKDWIRAWMDDFKPMDFGYDLWIVPSHHEPVIADATNIFLDPGMAFGTGTHPTTAMCLRWLAEHRPANQGVIDYGCGSGVLAIAAAKLGAREVLAVDNDPQALTATAENARRNGVEQHITTRHSDSLIDQPCDLIVANILAGPLISLVNRFSDILKPGGQIILSGLLTTQAPALIDAYDGLFTLTLTATNGDWGLLTGTKI